MKYLILPLKIIYLTWMAILYVVLMLGGFVFIMLGLLFPGKMKLKIGQTALRIWGFIWSLLVGVIYIPHDRNKIRKGQTYVIIVNHNSFLDTPAIYTTIPLWFKTLAKKSLSKVPIMGQIIAANGILVDRSSKTSRLESMNAMKNSLLGGTSLMVYPEGTQNRTENILQPFFEGAFKAAILAQVPVLPVAVINSRKILPQGHFSKLNPGKIHVHYLDPILTEGLTEGDVSALRDKTWGIMKAALEAKSKSD